jgi:hypothetical protein
MSQRRGSPQPGEGQFNLTEHARQLSGLLRAFAEKKAEVDRALAGGAAGEDAYRIMADLDRADEHLVQELKRWCRPDMEDVISTAWQEPVLLDTLDFASILAMAESILVGARRLADWAQDDPLDETGAELLADLAKEWEVLEIVLTANGIGRGTTEWRAYDESPLSAAQCLRDLIRAVRRGDTNWFVYLPVFGVCLLSLAPNARMGMPHAAFAKRLAVAVELLKKCVAPANQGQDNRTDEHSEPEQSPHIVLGGRKEDPIVFGPDFHSCRWGSKQFTFTEMQAACARVLWEARQRGTPDVSGKTVLEEAESAMVDSERPRLRDLFRDHPAWRTMIVSASKGTYRLADPMV